MSWLGRAGPPMGVPMGVPMMGVPMPVGVPQQQQQQLRPPMATQQGAVPDNMHRKRVSLTLLFSYLPIFVKIILWLCYKEQRSWGRKEESSKVSTSKTSNNIS